MEKKVKLDNSNSRFAKKAAEEKASKAEFNGNVENYQANQGLMVEKAKKLSSQYIEYVKDGRLNENKGPILLDLEKQIGQELAEFSLELNQDQTQPEGYGSAAIITLLLKTTLLQRDFINELRYRISKLEKSSSHTADGE